MNECNPREQSKGIFYVHVFTHQSLCLNEAFVKYLHTLNFAIAVQIGKLSSI